MEHKATREQVLCKEGCREGKKEWEKKGEEITESKKGQRAKGRRRKEIGFQLYDRGRTITPPDPWS
jgi:hypothetical protein